jgi:hypothetical protein
MISLKLAAVRLRVLEGTRAWRCQPRVTALPFVGKVCGCPFGCTLSIFNVPYKLVCRSLSLGLACLINLVDRLEGNK